MIKKKAHTAGFSLVEVIVVLALVVALCGLQLFPAAFSRQKLAEVLFWRNFRQNWTSLVIETRVRHDAGLVQFLGDSLYFCSASNAQKKQALAVPKTLHLTGGKLDENLYQNGGTQPQRITFYSDLDHQNYAVIFQLGYGGQYRIEKTAR
ncbi:prepilin-type N-terminal cleavage/methylation domain-containing protein [Ligilactobacillus pabuli]|nr:prepilin-type N-terminal cleavage/methylation domain-containing protein [Ligilactobacillus pabuli]